MKVYDITFFTNILSQGNNVAQLTEPCIRALISGPKYL